MVEFDTCVLLLESLCRRARLCLSELWGDWDWVINIKTNILLCFTDMHLGYCWLMTNALLTLRVNTCLQQSTFAGKTTSILSQHDSCLYILEQQTISQQFSNCAARKPDQ